MDDVSKVLLTIIIGIMVLLIIGIRNSNPVTDTYIIKGSLSKSIPMENLLLNKDYNIPTDEIVNTITGKKMPKKPPVPSKYVEDKKVNKRSKIHLKTVYIPKSPKKDIDRICQSIVDKEYKNGYIINDINTQMDSTGGIYLFLRFVRF